MVTAHITIDKNTMSSKLPVVPEDTCPYIDMVMELTDKMSDEEDQEWRNQQLKLVEALLEHIRASNIKLRASGKYWYSKKQK